MEKIICKNLTFTYALVEKPALHNINLSVNEGEFCIVMGESAAGKSTLLKLLKKEIAPNGRQEGELFVDGTVGYVAQNVAESIVCDKVRSELSFGLLNMGKSADEIELLVAETASYFDFENKLDADIASLSGGEMQLVNLAAVMIMKPQILVLDEPTAQLDPISSQRFIEMIKKLHKDFGITVIMSEHNTDLIYDYAQKIILLSQSRLEYAAEPRKTASYLMSGNNVMLDSIPPQMRLFDNVFDVAGCRRIISSLSLKPLSDEYALDNAVLKVKGLCFAYERGVNILDGLSLKVYKGKINAVVGPNSSGKSTLLKCISGVNKAYRGKIKCNEKISMLCQNPYDLFRYEKCSQEVEFGEITRFLEIDDIKNQHPYDISGGQAQRLALAKVLSTNGDIILLDEPTKGFDPILKKKLADLLNRLCNSGKTVLLVTHDIEFVGEYAHAVSFLSKGKIVVTAPRRSFFSQLSFYTTSISKITNGFADNVVSAPDLKEAMSVE